jgi:hypothetical protein
MHLGDPLLDPFSHELKTDHVVKTPTLAQKRRVMHSKVKAAIIWHPKLSDRAIARMLGCHHTLVAVVRRGGTWRNRKFSKSFWLNGWRDGAPKA